MYDPSSAFTHDDFFQSSIENDHVSTVAVPASENATQNHRPNIPETICGKSSAEADVPDLNPHREVLMDTISRGESRADSVTHEEVPVHRIEPKNRDQQKTAESDTVTSQGDMIEIEDLGLETNQDSVHAPTLHECPVKAAASCEEAAPGTVLMACEAAQDAQSDAKNTGNEPVQAAFGGENLAPDNICPSAPRRNVCRPMRPSRGIHPIDKSPSFVSAKRRHAVSLRPSRGVRPIMSQTFALAVVVEAASDPQTVLTRATDSTVSDSSSSESDPVPQPESRKREAAKQIVETAKRARQSDELSQKVRPRRSTRSSAEDAHYFKYNYESVQQKCDSLRRGIDDLDVQLRREVKGLQRRFKKEAQEAGDWFRKQHRGIVEKVQAEVRALEGKFQSDTEALQEQLDMFMVDLKNEGLVNLDA